MKHEPGLKVIDNGTTLQTTFSAMHGAADQFLQRNADAIGKAQPGWAGRRHCASHVATYSAGQLAAAIVMTRALGYRLPITALAAGTAVNATTHYVIDRRVPLKRFLVAIGKSKYLEHTTVQRRQAPDGTPVVEESGPGSALFECDQAAHRLIGGAASLVMTAMAVRSAAKKGVR